MTLNIPFEKWFKRDYASTDLCFLCGRDITSGKSTKEHIFPQWVLNKFQLWDKKFNLLNKQKFAYNRSFIPCCANCNNVHLSKLETEIKEGVEKGYEYFKNHMPTIRIYQWCQLIFYKWLYKETFFRENIKDPLSEMIVPQSNFDSMVLNHLLLRSIDKTIQFENFFPGSIFICQLKTSDDPSLNFDYLDDVSTQCMAIRLNDIGIIGILADSELQKILYGHLYTDIVNHTLAPLQFRNLFAQCTYTQYLFRDPFLFEVKGATDNEITLVQIPRPGFEGNVYGEWDDEQYLQLMSSVFNANPEQLRVSNGKAGSFFYDDQGKWKDRPYNDDGFKE